MLDRDLAELYEMPTKLRKYFLLYCFVILFLTCFISCRKDKSTPASIPCSGNCYILTGQIIDTPSTNKLSEVEIRLYYYLQVLTPVLGPRLVAKTKTDVDGKYTFKLDGTKFKDDPYGFFFAFTKPGYCYGVQDDKLNYFDLDSSNFDIPFVQNFALTKTARFKLHLKNGGLNKYDFLTFQYRFRNDNFGGGNLFSVDKQVDTTIAFSTAGDIRTIIYWVVTDKGNILIEKKDTLIIPADTQRDYEISL